MGVIQQCPACKNQIVQVILKGNILLCPHCNNALLMFDEDRGQQVRNLCILQEERESVNRYLKSISKPTGINFWEVLKENNNVKQP